LTDDDKELTHLDEEGRAKMVDVGGKAETKRVAVAEARVLMSEDTLGLIVAHKLPKGDVFAAARIAGIMAAKRTPLLIPLCHPVKLDSVTVEFTFESEPAGIRVVSEAGGTDRTGVEMEALTAAAVAALTIYDMCKSAERGITITDLRLLEKSGGKSHWKREDGDD